MNQIIKISLAWELFEQQIPKSHIPGLEAEDVLFPNKKAGPPRLAFWRGWL